MLEYYAVEFILGRDRHTIIVRAEDPDEAFTVGRACVVRNRLYNASIQGTPRVATRDDIDRALRGPIPDCCDDDDNEAKEGSSRLPQGWTVASAQDFWESVGGTFTGCVKRMKGEVEDPGAFCGNIKAVLVEAGVKSDVAELLDAFDAAPDGEIWLVVKGDAEDAAEEASDRGIPFTFVREIRRNDEGSVSGGTTPAIYAAEVAEWFGETGTPPFPVGTLLWFRYDEDEVAAVAERKRRR